jgi:hypothetical protein
MKECVEMDKKRMIFDKLIRIKIQINNLYVIPHVYIQQVQMAKEHMVYFWKYLFYL